MARWKWHYKHTDRALCRPYAKVKRVTDDPKKVECANCIRMMDLFGVRRAT